MPSAQPVGNIGKDAVFLGPVKQALIQVEHKIRNLEKRKGKLDQYRSEQDQGKELNADQLSAVAKYSEVIQQLDFGKEIVKQFNQISEETKRLIKKEQKKEVADKAAGDLERCRLLILFQSVLKEFRDDQYLVKAHLNGAPGTIPLTPEDVEDITKLFSILQPPRRDPNFKANIAEGANRAVMLLEGKSKELGHKSFKEVKELLVAISESEYFLNRPSGAELVAATPPKPSPPAPVVEPPVIPKPVENVPPVQVIPIQQESTYSFLQESQIDIESPHMDPAVVAVSSFVPPPISQPSERLNLKQTTFTNSALAPNNALPRAGRGDCAVTIEDEIDTWNGPIGEFNDDTNKQPVDDGENSNRDGNKSRGGYRGARRLGRGRPNGFTRNTRGRGRGFSNGPTMRMGHYRNNQAEYEAEKEFRSRLNGNDQGGIWRPGTNESNNYPRGGSRGGYRGGPPSGGFNKSPRDANNTNGATAEYSY